MYGSNKPGCLNLMILCTFSIQMYGLLPLLNFSFLTWNLAASCSTFSIFLYLVENSKLLCSLCNSSGY